MTRRPDRMLAIAHRSGNTVAGLREALDVGADLVECDVHAYRGVLEVRHLKTLGPQHLWDKWELVRRADYVRLELGQLLEALGDDPRLMVDLKGTRPGLALAVARALSEHGPDTPFTVCTKSWWMLDQFGPAVRRVLSASNRVSLQRLRRRLRDAPAYGVSIRLSLLTRDVVAQLRDRTQVVMTWPVDTPEALATAQELGVDAIISKDLALLRSLVSEG
jgi:glycerophosphoryl diester phosphodiesterase